MPDTGSQPVRLARRLTLAGLLLAGAARLWLAAARFGDQIGFSSNREFYFHIRHPVRAAVLEWSVWIGLALAITAGLLWLWLAARQRHAGG